ncbi:MAG: pilus assembly protein TadG-related protein, partial [Planctomycetaceae bacterium]
MRRLRVRWPSLQHLPPSRRRGVFLVIAAVTLTAVMALVAFSVDLGYQSLTKTRMQNATDAAALAAAMEITHALQTGNPNLGDVFANAVQSARGTAFDIAHLNDIYIDSNRDVVFGRRSYVPGTQNLTTSWNVANDQVNVVKVIARRDNPDTKAPDGKLPGIFSSVFGATGASLTTESIAFIDPRDIIVVHDFSRSMNFDSYYTDEQNTKLTQAQVDANLDLVWSDLQPLNLGTMTYNPQYASKTQTSSGASATVTFKGTSALVTTNTKLKTVKLTFSSGSQTFNISNETTTSGTYSGTGSYANKRITQVDVTVRKVGSTTQSVTLSSHQYNANTVIACFGLTNVTYPYAQGSWSEYVSFVQTNSGLALYNSSDLYGGKTFLCYLMKSRSSYNETKDLWKTRHYPFHAIKQGHELLCDYLTELGFDDHLGMVSYDASHRVETKINDTNPDMPQVDISASPITSNYDAVKKLMHYKQASHYSDSTNMAGGMKEAVALLDNHKRAGTRPAILLMTDGNGNTLDSGENGSLPAGWNWNTMFDYNGDGVADYSSTNTSAC